jgi:hypothetical protein
MNKHEYISVTSLPNCDLCGSPAYADALLPSYGGWGSVCLDHFKQYGCTLGLGHGQGYILEVVN